MNQELASAEQALTLAARQAIHAYTSAIEEKALASLTAAGSSYRDRPLWRRLVAQYLAPAFGHAWRQGFAATRRVQPEPGQDTHPDDLDQLATRTIGITDRVADAFRTALGRGESRDRLRERVAELASDDVWQGQAEIMGRTAAVSALNAGSMAGALDAQQRSGTRWEKTWLATSDARTRHTHRAAHGQRRKLNEPFKVGRSRLQFPGDPKAPPSEVLNCRCTLLLAERGDPSLNAPPLPAVEAPMNQSLSYAPWDALTAAGGVTLDDDGAWSGPISLVNTWSADGRMLALADNEPLQVRPLPLPVAVQYQLAQGHDGAKVGLMTLDSVHRDGTQVIGSGRIDTTDPEGAALARKIEAGFLRFVSADIDQADAETVCISPDGTPDAACDPDDPTLSEGREMGQVFTGWRIMGATLVAHPAFPEAHVTLAENAPPPPAADDSDTGEDDAEGCYLFDEASGEWTPAPCETEGALPADELPEDAVIAATSDTPAEDAEEDEEVAVGEAESEDVCYLFDETSGLWEPSDCAADGAIPAAELPDDAELAPAAEAAALEHALTASASGGWVPPTEYFRNPNLAEPTLWQYDPKTRRVFGHVALWNVPHVSYQGKQVFAPHSPTSYERFHLKPIQTSEGLVEVGPFCLGTDHAPHTPPGRNAGGKVIDHYESTGSIVAAVRCGEDAFGIWMSGVLFPHVTDEQMLQLQLSTVSGDWRNEGHGLDLKAVLAVPAGHEGFYTPKPVPADRSDYALVASGALTSDVVDTARRRTTSTPRTVQLARTLGRADQLAARATARRLGPRQARAQALAARATGRRLGARRSRIQALAARTADPEAEADRDALNWVDDVGGLPRYIREIADALMRSGRTESTAIAIAVGRTKAWCRGGGDVKADTRAKACAAVASWEAKKAAARAS